MSNLAIAPRLCLKAEAAVYCCIKISTFDHWVKKGILPGPVSGTSRWDFKAIDNALDNISGILHVNEDDCDADLEKRITGHSLPGASRILETYLPKNTELGEHGIKKLADFEAAKNAKVGKDEK